MSTYSEDVNIDKNNLDEECVLLPSQYEHWASEEEKHRSNYEILITKRRVVKATVGLGLRGMSLKEINTRFKTKLTKLTEQTYQDLVYIHIDIIAVTKERDEAHSEYAIAKAARQSFEKKKAMLEYLTSLHGQGYFIRVKGQKFKEHEERALQKRLAKTIEKKTKTRRIKT